VNNRFVASATALIVFLAGLSHGSVLHGEQRSTPIANPMELSPLIGNLAHYDALVYGCRGERDGRLREGLADGDRMFDWQAISQRASRMPGHRGGGVPESIDELLVAYDEAFEQRLANVRDLIRRRDEQRRADPCTDRRLEEQRDAAGMQAVRIRHPSFLNADTEDPEEAFAALPAEARESLLTEKEQIENYCSRQGGMFSTLYDCGCIGDRFLEVRLIEDPYTPALRLMNGLARACPNRPALVDYGVASCMGNSTQFADTADAVCECAGERFADQVVQTASPTLSWMGNLAVRVTEECRTGYAQGSP